MKIDKSLLDRILKEFDFDGKHKEWNMFQVVEHVYNSVYLYWFFKYNECKENMNQYERTIVEKNMHIEKLEKCLTDQWRKSGWEESEIIKELHKVVTGG